MAQTADFGDHDHEGDGAEGQQPDTAFNGHEDSRAKDRTHDQPNNNRQKKFHYWRESDESGVSFQACMLSSQASRYLRKRPRPPRRCGRLRE